MVSGQSVGHGLVQSAWKRIRHEWRRPCLVLSFSPCDDHLLQRIIAQRVPLSLQLGYARLGTMGGNWRRVASLVSAHLAASYNTQVHRPRRCRLPATDGSCRAPHFTGVFTVYSVRVVYERSVLHVFRFHFETVATRCLAERDRDALTLLWFIVFGLK